MRRRSPVWDTFSVIVFRYTYSSRFVRVLYSTVQLLARRCRYIAVEWMGGGVASAVMRESNATRTASASAASRLCRLARIRFDHAADPNVSGGPLLGSVMRDTGPKVLVDRWAARWCWWLRRRRAGANQRRT